MLRPGKLFSLFILDYNSDNAVPAAITNCFIFWNLDMLLPVKRPAAAGENYKSTKQKPTCFHKQGQPEGEKNKCNRVI
jgi:hypothetical protein